MRKLSHAFITLVAVALVVVWGGALAQTVPYGVQLFAGPTSSPLIIQQTGTQNSCYFRESESAGKVPGPVNAFGSNDGILFLTPLQILNTTDAVQSQPYTPSNNVEYRLYPIGFAYVEVIPDAGWNASTQVATTYGRCSSSIALKAGPAGASGPPGTTGPSGPPGTSCPSPGANIQITTSPGCTVALSPSPAPSATTTACGANPSFTLWTITIPVCPTPSAGPTAGPGSCNNCLLKGVGSTYDSVVLAEAHATHFYKLNDPSPCPTFGDSIGAGATAVPSPVSLTTSAPGLRCGAPSISYDGELSVENPFPSPSPQPYAVIPASVLPTSGSFSVEILAKPGCSTCVMFTLAAATTSSQALLLFMTTSTNLVSFSVNGQQFNTSGGSYFGPVLMDYVWDGTHSTYYINGDPVGQNANAPTYPATAGALMDWNSGQYGYFGRLSKFSIYNTALTGPQIWSHAAALGI